MRHSLTVTKTKQITWYVSQLLSEQFANSDERSLHIPKSLVFGYCIIQHC